MGDHIWIPSNSDKTRSCPKCGLSFNRKTIHPNKTGSITEMLETKLQDVEEARLEAEIPDDCDEEMVRQVMES